MRRHSVNLVALAVLAVLVLVGSLAVSAASPTYLGKNPGKIQGRWLEVKNSGALRAVESVYLGEMQTDIQWKKEANESEVDESVLAEDLHDQLLERLRTSRALGQVLSSPPPAGTANVVRLDCTLVVEPGSRSARYLVGFGAGKSKSILEIHLLDEATGEEIGLYHGYGTGSGMGFKLAGGKAEKMTEDDIQENTKLFTELLAEAR